MSVPAPGNSSLPYRLARKFLLFLVLFSIGLMALILLMTPIRTSHEESIKSEIIARHHSSLRLVELTIQQRMRQMARDVRFLASLSPLLASETAGPTEHSRLVENVFLELVRANPTYDQARILGTDGMELLRVNRTADGSELVPRQDLQSKASRYYVRKVLETRPGGIYFSPLDLNVENGIIEQPIKPVIRVATRSLEPGGGHSLIFMINYRASQLLDQIRRLFQSGFAEKAMLVNQDGYWLIDAKDRREWGQQLGHPEHRLQTDNQALWNALQSQESGIFAEPDKIYVFRKIRPFSGVPDPEGTSNLNKGPAWYLISEINEGAWRGRSFIQGRAGQLTVLVLISLVASLALALTLLIARRHHR
ncbi:diguanylate cyclase [Marinobacter santoriniensis NKSG1]|uniref:Diguanylate cyclase n=1 Tax=Marinobacter santoriniensis NKSG1 TaxID=1288826 RepID=M7CK79_9GAMM|nr:hypothetical protein [Marinobacter santoriniensis]EMP54071.1 diguanylate cyclase [Marinobacter santoriniensis NKSG1]